MYTGGSVKLGGRDVASLPSAVTGRRISFVGQDIYHFPTSVRENLLYGLKHRPLIEAHYEGGELVDRKWRIDEAALSGNPDFDPNADWIDYGAAGAEGPADIGGRLTEMLRLVELEADVYRFGLTGTLDPAARPEAAAAILQARDQLLERLVKDGCDDLVIRFDANAYNVNATLAENLLFGTPKDPDYQTSKLAENPVLQKVLNEQGLFGGLLEMGASIAHTMVEILGDLPSGHPVFNQFSFIGEDDLPDFRTMVARCDSLGLEKLRDDEKERFLGLPFLYVEARHRLGLIEWWPRWVARAR